MCYQVHDHIASLQLHFRNTSDNNILSDSLYLFGCIRIPPWLKGLDFRTAESESSKTGSEYYKCGH